MASVIHDDEIDWNAYMRSSDAQRKVVPASRYVEEAMKLIGAGPSTTGAMLPWSKTADSIRLRPGETSIWAGINGHGKSLLTGQVAQALMAQDQKVVIASFEMKPAATIARMIRQASCGPMPTDLFGAQWKEWSDGRLWLYDHLGVLDNIEQLYALVRYAHERIGAQHVFVDSLMKCLRAEDDYNGQKSLMENATALSRDLGVHVHLVHHSKKREDEKGMPGKFDLKGSGSISDQADNVFVVWRNKAKQFDRQSGKDVDETWPDAMLVCEKQRHGEWEGRVQLWFDDRSQQFVGHHKARPMNPMEFMHGPSR